MDKDLLTSKIFWGAIVTLIATAATALGYDIGDQDLLINSIIAVAGGFLAIYGRFGSIRKITSVAGMKVDGK